MLGTGIQGDPYIIQNVTDLQAMKDSLAAYYELGGNIDASATTGWNWNVGREVFEGFEPVGNTAGIFTGQLDGRGFTISGLYINRFYQPYSIGLFGYTSGAIIKYTNLTSLDITSVTGGTGAVGNTGGLVGYALNTTISNCSTTGSITGYRSVGGFAGIITGTSTVRDCYSTCTVASTLGGAGGFAYYIASGTTTTHCCATGTVTSNGSFDIGGFAQYIEGTVLYCYATGAVTGSITGTDAGGFAQVVAGAGVVCKCYATGAVSGKLAGGFVGQNYGTVYRCYATGAVTSYTSWLSGVGAGGFVGSVYSGSSTNNCYAKGAVEGYYAGGFVKSVASGSTITNSFATGLVTGTQAGGFAQISSGTITNCFWDTQTTGQASSAGGVIGKTTAQMKVEATFTEAGWDFTNIWNLASGVNGGYPNVNLSVYPCIAGTHTYPGDITRVTAIRHIYRPGLFRMEVTLGDVQNAIDMIDTKVRKEVGAPLSEVLGPPSSEWLQERLKALGIPYPKEQPPTIPQYTPEVPQPPPVPYPQYTPEVPQPAPPSPPIPSFIDIFKERMWGWAKDPMAQIMETWRKIKWW